MRNVRDPGQPTAKEHQEHMTAHRQHRSWCKFCVMGRGVNAPHRRSNAQDDLDGMPHVSMDYGFLGERDSEEQTSPVLVIRERRHKMTWAMLVPRKGTEFTWIAKRAAKFIDQLGHNSVTLRCDNEPAIEAPAREVALARKPQQQCAWSVAEDLGKAKHVDMQNLWIQDAFQVWPVCREEGWHECESSRLDGKSRCRGQR